MEEKTQSLDIKFFTATLILLGIGVAFMYGASARFADKVLLDRTYFFNRQLIYAIFSIIVIIAVSRLNPNVFFRLAYVLLFITIISLILVLIPGIGSERKGARRWIHLGFFNYQPSELAKITILIFLSKYLALYDKDSKNNIKLLLPVFLVVVLFFALIVLEKDFSTSILLLITSLSLIFLSGASLKYFAYLAVTGMPIIYFLITSFEHMKARLNVYLMKFFLPNYVPHQEKQAMKAISNAGLFGNGLGVGSFHSRVPESHTDFYFASIVSDIGLLGGLFVILIFAFIYFKSFKLAYSIKEKKYSYLVYGITLLFVWQTILNLGSVLGLLPIAGLPLPFLSFGGNSLITSSFAIGLIFSISRHQSN